MFALVYSQPITQDGHEFVTVSVDGTDMAVVEKEFSHAAPGYLIHRNGISCGPLPREDVAPFLSALADAVHLAAMDQNAAEATDGFGALTVNDLLDAEFGDNMTLF